MMKKIRNVLFLALLAVVARMQSAPPTNSSAPDQGRGPQVTDDVHGTRDSVGSDAHGTQWGNTNRESARTNYNQSNTNQEPPWTNYNRANTNQEPPWTNYNRANTNQEPPWTNYNRANTNQEPPWTNRFQTNGYQIPPSTNTIPQPAPPRR